MEISSIPLSVSRSPPSSSILLVSSSHSSFFTKNTTIALLTRTWTESSSIAPSRPRIEPARKRFTCNALFGLGEPEVVKITGKTVKISEQTKDFAVPRRSTIALILSSYLFTEIGWHDVAFARPSSVAFREYIDSFDGYSFKYPQNWIQVRGAGADIFFRDPYVLDENLSMELSSPSSSQYKSVEDLGPPEEAGKKVLKQYLTEFMSTRLGVKREAEILSTSSRVADDGKLYYQVEVNIKSYANNNELAVMPQDRIARLEWNRRYLSVLGVENNQLYELRLQTPENVFVEEESDLRKVMESFRVNKVVA